MHVKIYPLLDQKDVPRGSCREAIVTLSFFKWLLCQTKLNGEGLRRVEMPFPRGREKVERSDLSQVCLLKGGDVSEETIGQQVQQKRATPFSPALCVGVAWLYAPGCSACQGHSGHTKGLQEKSLYGAITNQGTVIPHCSGILLILGCQKLARPAPGEVSLFSCHRLKSGSKQQQK